MWLKRKQILRDVKSEYSFVINSLTIAKKIYTLNVLLLVLLFKEFKITIMLRI